MVAIWRQYRASYRPSCSDRQLQTGNRMPAQKPWRHAAAQTTSPVTTAASRVTSTEPHPYQFSGLRLVSRRGRAPGVGRRGAVPQLQSTAELAVPTAEASEHRGVCHSQLGLARLCIGGRGVAAVDGPSELDLLHRDVGLPRRIRRIVCPGRGRARHSCPPRNAARSNEIGLQPPLPLGRLLHVFAH